MSCSSVSKIQCLESCPNKYKLTYIDKVSQESCDAFEKGKTLHFILEHLEYFDIIRNFFDSDIGKKFYDIIKDGSKEKKIGLTIQNKSIVDCDFNDKNCLIRGVIDVVSSNNIIDYKSGKYVEYNNQKWLQLEFYALWLFSTSNYDEIHVHYVYIEHNKVNSKTFKRSEYNTLVKNVFSKINTVIKYERNPTTEHNISPLCDYCGVRKYCEYYKSVNNDDVLLNSVDITF